MDPLGHLSEKERQQRYNEKISLIGCDPYKIPKVELSADKELYPSISYPDIVNYLVFARSAFNTEQFMSYKSLEAYTFFTSGWVREPTVKVLNNLHVIVARVSFIYFIYL